LHHTSGLRDQWELLTLAGWRYSLDLITDGDILAVVSRQKALNFAPGRNTFIRTPAIPCWRSRKAWQRPIVS